MKKISSIILKKVGIDCVDVDLCCDLYTNKNGCLVTNYLKDEADVSYEITGWKLQLCKEKREELKISLEQVFNKYSLLHGITKEEIENIKRSYIRIIFGKCITENFDAKLENIGLIFNEKTKTYRLPPSFDNGFSFKSYNSFSEPVCFIGDQFFGINQIVDYIIENYYEYISDIIPKFYLFVENEMEPEINQFDNQINPQKKLYIFKYLNDLYIRIKNMNLEKGRKL